MRPVAIILTAAAVVAGGSLFAPAEARDGCGRGYYYNGYACVPEYRGPPPGYYGQPQGYYRGPGPSRAIQGESSFGRPEVWFQPGVDRRGQLRCQPGYTVQDGVCKRYRGY